MTLYDQILLLKSGIRKDVGVSINKKSSNKGSSKNVFILVFSFITSFSGCLQRRFQKPVKLLSKLSRENTMPGNACDIKDKRLWWVLIQKQPSEGFLKKGVMRNFGKFTRKWLCRTNEALAQVFSCEFCKICKNTFSHFLQNTTGQLLLIIVVLVVVKGELANETYKN